MLIVGLLVLCFPAVSINVMTIVLGILFAVFGIGRIVAAFTASGTPAGWRVLDGLAGILLVLSSVFIFRHVYASTGILLTFISITLGISWIVEGFTTLIERDCFHYWRICVAVLADELYASTHYLLVNHADYFRHHLDRPWSQHAKGEIVRPIVAM